MKDVSVAVLRYLGMEKPDDVLKAFQRDLFLCASALTDRAGAGIVGAWA